MSKTLSLPGDKKPAKLMTVKLLRNTWRGTEKKFMAGELLDVSIKEAKEWIGKGVAERADPMPSDD